MWFELNKATRVTRATSSSSVSTLTVGRNDTRRLLSWGSGVRNHNSRLSFCWSHLRDLNSSLRFTKATADPEVRGLMRFRVRGMSTGNTKNQALARNSYKGELRMVDDGC